MIQPEKGIRIRVERGGGGVVVVNVYVRCDSYRMCIVMWPYILRFGVKWLMLIFEGGMGYLELLRERRVWRCYEIFGLGHRERVLERIGSG